MAASGLAKCGAPSAEHTSSTGTVWAVPGVTASGQIVVEVVGAAVVVEAGAEVGGAVTGGPAAFDALAPQAAASAAVISIGAIHRHIHSTVLRHGPLVATDAASDRQAG